MTTEAEKGWFTAMTGIFLEGVLLACAMALPFLLISGYVAGLLSICITGLWWWIGRLMSDPDALEKPTAKVEFWSPVGLLEGSAVAAALGALALGLAATMQWGYHASVDTEIFGWLRLPAFPVPIALFTASALFLGAFYWRRRASLPIASGPNDGLADGAAGTARAWFDTFADFGAIFAYLTVTLVTTGFHVIFTSMYDGDGPDALEFLGHAPIVALAIPMAGLMTAARLRAKLAAPGHDPAGSPSGASSTVWRVSIAIRLACFVPATAAMVYSLHLINVSISSSLPAMTTSLETGTEVFDFVAARHEEGEAIGDIADRLNRHGQEAGLGDSNGLFGLLPEKENRQFGSIRNNRCTVSLQAGIAKIPEVEAVIRRARKKSSSPSNPPDPGGPLRVKYCVKISCPSLAIWEKEPMWTLYTSHPSEQPGWGDFFRIRPFFEGQPVTPGGYCNADGTLAESYQG